MQLHAATLPETPIQAIRRQLRVELLTRGRVVIVGLGGIGLILSRYLTLFLASFAEEEFRLLLCDGDAFEPANRYRMDVPDFDNKAAAVADQLSQLFGRSGLHLRWIPEFVTPANLEQVIQTGDCVFLCVDNHATRKLVSDRCRQLSDIVLISGGNDGVEHGQQGTYGNVQVYVREAGRDRTAPLDRFHPEIATPLDHNPAELDCMEQAAAGTPQLLFTNLAIASAMANALLRLLMCGDRPIYDEVCLDIVEATSVPQWLKGVS